MFGLSVYRYFYFKFLAAERAICYLSISTVILIPASEAAFNDSTSPILI